VALLLLALSIQGGAGASRLLSTIHVGPNPGIIDLSIASVDFDALSGKVTVSGTVSCAAPLDLLFVDFDAAQGKPSVATGFSTVAPECASQFSAVIDSEPPFKPGRLTIEATAFACAAEGGCAAEVVRIDALLSGKVRLWQPACPNPAELRRPLAHTEVFTPGCRGPLKSWGSSARGRL
jgi:hypothetical protein